MLFYQFLAHQGANMVTYRNWIHKSHRPMDLGVTGTTSQIRRVEQILSARSGSSIPCASLAAFGARPFGSCGHPAAFQGWAADWWEGMAAPLQQCVQMVVIANGNVWRLFAKCAPEQTKGQLSITVRSGAWALFTEEGEAEERLGYHTKQGRRDDWSVGFWLGWSLWGLFCDSTGCCCTCACLPQCVGTNVASRMLCLLLQGWYSQGVAGEGQTPRKNKVLPVFLP